MNFYDNIIALIWDFMDYRCEQGEFNAICTRLASFGQVGQERIAFDALNKPILQPKAPWLSRVVSYFKRLFSCDTHPAERVAQCILQFFEENRKNILPEHLLVISKLSAIKCTSAQTKRDFQALFNTHSMPLADLSQQREKLATTQHQIELDRAATTRRVEQTRAETEREMTRIVTEAETKAAEVVATADQKFRDTQSRVGELEAKTRASIATLRRNTEMECKALLNKAHERARAVETAAVNHRDLLFTTAAKAREQKPILDISLKLDGPRSVYQKLFKMTETMDVVLLGTDLEEVQAHSIILRNISSYFHVYFTHPQHGRMAADVKEVAAAATTVRIEIEKVGKLVTFDFSKAGFSSETLKLFREITYEQFQGEIHPIESVLEIYRLSALVDAEKVQNLMRSFIFTLVEKRPEILFEVVPGLDKSHPAIPILLTALIDLNRWYNWNCVPSTSVNELVTWLLEYETPAYAKHLQEPAVAVALSDIYFGVFNQPNNRARAMQLLELASNTSSFASARLGICILEFNHSQHANAKEKDARVVEEENKRAWELLEIGKVSRYGKYVLAKLELTGQYGRKVNKEAVELKLLRGWMHYPPSGYQLALIEAEKKDKNDSRYADYLVRASNGGHLKARTALALMHLNIPSDRWLVECPKLSVEKGVQLLIETAHRGEKMAQFHLGELYSTGKPPHINLDKAQARFWYEKSAAQGYEPAVQKIAELG